jgi:toxin ParE1/3/4
MTSSRRIRFTAQGRRDFQAIMRHTARTWGERQRDEYAGRVTAALEQIASFPDLGRARKDLYPGLRSHSVGEHVVYYEVDDVSIIVNRILHARMDPTRHIQP